MPQQTDLHDWTIPVPDDISPEDRDQWGGILTAFFDGDLDTEVPLQGPIGDRPLASGYPGLVWITTDTNPVQITRSNGTGYDVIGTSNADTLDGLHRSQFAANMRTFPITTSSAPSNGRIKIAKISDGTGDEAGAFFARLVHSVGEGNTFTNVTYMICGVGNSASDIGHYVLGKGSANQDSNAGLVVSESTGTGSGGENEYYLYVEPASATDSTLFINHTESFGDFDFTPDLTEDDVIGTEIYNTINDPTSIDIGFGEIDVNSIDGGVTGGVDLRDITGENLTIEGGALTASDTRVNVSDDGTQVLPEPTDVNFGTNLSVTDDGDQTVTVDSTGGGGGGGGGVDISDDGSSVVTDATGINFGSSLAVIDDGDQTVTVNNTGTPTSTTLYMSDYTTPDDGNPDDSEFETAVSAASPGDTIVFDHGNYLFNSSHVIHKPLTLEGVDATIEYTNTSNNNAMFFFDGGGLTGTNTTLSAPEGIGEFELGVGDTTGFSAGDRVLILEGTYSSSVNAQMRFDRLESVDDVSSSLLLDGALEREYSASTTVYKVELLDAPTFENINTHGGGNRHLQFRWCENPTFRDCAVSEYLEVSLYALDCWKPRWYDCEARKPLGLGSGEGEPVAAYRCNDGYMESLRIDHCRRGIDFAWGAHNFTIVDPQIRRVSLVGIGVHQNDIGGDFSIFGGQVVCSQGGQSGHCIAFSSTSNLEMVGTTLYARQSGIIAGHSMSISDVTIYAVPSTEVDGVGLRVLGGPGVTTFENIKIYDEEGAFTYPVYYGPQGSDLEFSKCDVDIRYPDQHAIYVDARDASDTIEFLEFTGSINGLNQSDETMFIRADEGFIQTIDVSMTFRHVRASSAQCVRVYAEPPGTVRNLDFHNCYMDSSAAAIYTDGTGSFGTIRISDSTFDTGPTSLSFDETVAKLLITNNDVSGSIDSSGATESVITGNI